MAHDSPLTRSGPEAVGENSVVLLARYVWNVGQCARIAAVVWSCAALSL